MQVQNSNSNLNAIVQNWLVKQLADQLSLDAKSIDVTEPLTRYGLDSIDAVTMVGDLEDWVGEELPSTLFWDHATIEKASLFLVENYTLDHLASESAPVATAPVAAKPEPATSGGKGWSLFGRR
jgi:acyl carrier protein